jgi:gamma-glutamyltranspeptidase/glutathione hydrolase
MFPLSRPLLTAATLAAALVLSGCATDPVSPPSETTAAPQTPTLTKELPPEPPTITAKDPVVTHHAMVVAANPLASQAGREILEKGGSAVDAAIAVQLVLGLVEPQSSGIGGGAFLLHWDASQHLISSWDGRETAPAAATETLFLDKDGKPMAFFDAVVGGRSVGVPGVLRMLESAHARHGKLPWKDLFAPAITLAEAGFPVSPRLHSLLSQDRYLKNQPAARAYFYDAAGNAWPVGTILRNKAYAQTLRTIADKGADAFYTGTIAKDIVTAVRRHPTNPGLLTQADLSGYQAINRSPLCVPWKNYSVCGMAPPSSGGVAVAQILKLIEPFDTALLPPTGSQTAHYLAEAGRLAFADRALYLADPEFVSVPVAGLLDATYLKDRATLINPARAMEDAQPGKPAGAPQVAEGQTLAQPSTSHLVIVDAKGNAVSMTSSVENAFGSRLMVDGFILNNQLTDFSFKPKDAKGLVANRVQGGKRPLSSMSPTMVFGSDGKLAMLVGSPGGSRIIGYVAQTILATLGQGMDPQMAVTLPHVVNRDRPVTEVETAALKAPLEARGHQVEVVPMTSGLNVILLRHLTPPKPSAEDKPAKEKKDDPFDWRHTEPAAPPTVELIGASDPRREGAAVGF